MQLRAAGATHQQKLNFGGRNFFHGERSGAELAHPLAERWSSCERGFRDMFKHLAKIVVSLCGIIIGGGVYKW